MKKYVRKLSAVLMALAMVFTVLSIPVSAATPAATDTVTGVTVKGVESGATVKGYKIVEGNYSAAGLVGYKAVTGVTLADVYAPTDEEIGTIIDKGVTSLTTIEFKEDSSTGNYVCNDGITAGTYLVLVESTGKTIFLTS